MYKIFNWFFGSFFRTLGRILVFILLGYILFNIVDFDSLKLPNLFSIMNVNAYELWPSSDSINFKVNGEIITTTNTRYTPSGNVQFRFQSDEVFEPSYDSNQIRYGFFSVCQAIPYNVVEFSSGTYSKNFNVYNTSIPCKIYSDNGGYYPNARLIYGIFELNLGLGSNNTNLMCKPGSSSILCTLDNKFDLTVNQSEEWTLYNYGFSNEPFVFDSASNTLINQNGTIISQNQSIINGVGDINNSINNSDSSGATNDAGNFFSGFTTDLHGLTGIITAPLNAINSLTNKTCSPLVLPIPFVNKDLTLPCMRSIYIEHFGGFMTIYDTITLGIVSYWIMVRIFNLVKDFKNPEHDEIEVLDL